MPVDAGLVADIEPTLEAAEETMALLLGRSEPPTAVFCTNDTIAAGAMKAVIRSGLKVPQDVAIVGFDDSYISRVLEPELTTVRIDAAEMGRLAIQKLFDLMEGAPVEERLIEIPTELIIRASS